jgi:hypothetical protein
MEIYKSIRDAKNPAAAAEIKKFQRRISSSSSKRRRYRNFSKFQNLKF